MSGFIVRFPAVESVPGSYERNMLREWMRALGAGKKRTRRNDTADAVRAFGLTGALCYEQPPRGRGWCPKLAGVQL